MDKELLEKKKRLQKTKNILKELAGLEIISIEEISLNELVDMDLRRNKMIPDSKIGFSDDVSAIVNWIEKAFLLRKTLISILCKYNLELETRSEWFHYKYQATEEFYAHNESTYPGLNYIIKSVNLGRDLSLWLRIEIDYKLFGSLCVFDYGAESNTGYEVGNQCDDISDELWAKLREHVNLPEKKEKKGWIIAWKYLPMGSDSTVDAIETVPDFKEMNEAAISLVDEVTRKAFVSRCITALEETLLSLIR